MLEMGEPNLYQELTIRQLINPDTPRIETSLTPQLINLNTTGSLKFLNHKVSLYAEKQKNLIRKEQRKYLRNVVKGVRNALLVYSKNDKSVGDIFENSQKSTIFEIFDSYEPKIFKNEHINLERKYNASLSIQYSTLKQAEAIIENKNAYRHNRSTGSLPTQPLVQRMIALKKNSNKQPSKAKIEKNRFVKNQSFFNSISMDEGRHDLAKRKCRQTEQCKDFTVFDDCQLRNGKISLAQPHSQLTLSKKMKFKPKSIAFRPKLVNGDAKKYRERKIQTLALISYA